MKLWSTGKVSESQKRILILQILGESWEVLQLRNGADHISKQQKSKQQHALHIQENKKELAHEDARQVTSEYDAEDEDDIVESDGERIPRARWFV